MLNKGLTLIEILITTAIITVIFSLGLVFGIDFYKNYAFHSERDVIVSVLEKARSQALNNINQKAHGVYFSGANYVIFQGNSYVERNPLFDLIIPKSYSVILSGLNEIVFSRLSGESNASGTITVSGDGRASDISINNEGQINW
ncbi:prepilin-type N-terminal cleavage/methylation domain-containing protein [Candidatus Wolfebacteria bacterium]|nr:prepilin-type N-terminal cleavage/methylation domain-containing protein [Candidatus Wolfebacteria bacterium]